MLKLEKCLKALADKNRLRILKLLQHKKMCVCELAYILGITQPSVSRHLNKLKSAGFIGSEQEGLWTNYLISGQESIYVSNLLHNMSEWLNEDKIVISDKNLSDNIDRKKLCM